MSLYNLASGELKKENNKLKQEIDKLVDTNEDINREFSQYKYESKKEIERLNNIINELEHDFESYELEYLQDTYQGSLADFIETELERIQELKGSSK